MGDLLDEILAEIQAEKLERRGTNVSYRSREMRSFSKDLLAASQFLLSHNFFEFGICIHCYNPGPAHTYECPITILRRVSNRYYNTYYAGNAPISKALRNRKTLKNVRKQSVQDSGN